MYGDIYKAAHLWILFWLTTCSLLYFNFLKDQKHKGYVKNVLAEKKMQFEKFSN